MDLVELAELAEREALEEEALMAKWVEREVIDLDELASLRLVPDTESCLVLIGLASIIADTWEMWPADIFYRALLTKIAAWAVLTEKMRLDAERWSRMYLQMKQSPCGCAMIVECALHEERDIAADPEARAALEFLARTFYLRPYSKEAWSGLRSRAFQEGKSYAAVLHEAMFEALIEAFLRRLEPTDYRLSSAGVLYRGRRYRGGYLRQGGKRLQCAPHSLPAEFYLWWLGNEARRLVRDDLAGKNVTLPSVPSEVEILLSRTAEMQSLQAALSSPVADVCRPLLRLAGGSEKESTVWLLHKAGYSFSDIALYTGKARGTVKHQFHDMEVKWNEFNTSDSV